MQKTTRQELQKIKEIVLAVLQARPHTRHNDNLLYYMVCDVLAARQGLDIDKMSFGAVFRGGWQGLPRYESVVRMRRMVQRENPDLRPKIKVRRGRRKQEADFVEYARRKGEV